MKRSETFNFGPWTVTSVKGTILKADALERSGYRLHFINIYGTITNYRLIYI